MADTTYEIASVEAVGRNVAIMFKAMIENGMEREEALEVVMEWVRIAASPKDIGHG